MCQVSFLGSGQYGEGWSSVWRVKQDTSHIEPHPSSRLKSFISSSLPTGSQGWPRDPSVPTPVPTPILCSSLGNFSWFPQSIRSLHISRALPRLLPPPGMPSPHPHLSKAQQDSRTAQSLETWLPGLFLPLLSCVTWGKPVHPLAPQCLTWNRRRMLVQIVKLPLEPNERRFPKSLAGGHSVSHVRGNFSKCIYLAVPGLSHGTWDPLSRGM